MAIWEIWFPRRRFVGLAVLELAWRSTRTVYSSSPPALPPAPPPSSSNRAPGRAVYCVSAHFTLERRCHRALHTALRVDLLAMVAIVNTKRNKRIAYRVLDPELLCDIRAFDRTSRLRVHSPVRCGWGAWCWGGLDSAFGSCAFVDPLRVCFVDALWPRHGGPQCCHSTVAVA